MTTYEAGASDLLFFYDTVDLRTETEAEILAMLIQPSASMFYNRGYGCGIPMSEGVPASAVMQVKIRTDVVSAFANRNRQVVSGASGQVDRRAYASQSTVTIEQDPSTGEVEIQVGYLLAADVSAVRTTRVPGGK